MPCPLLCIELCCAQPFPSLVRGMLCKPASLLSVEGHAVRALSLLFPLPFYCPPLPFSGSILLLSSPAEEYLKLACGFAREVLLLLCSCLQAVDRVVVSLVASSNSASPPHRHRRFWYRCCNTDCIGVLSWFFSKDRAAFWL